MPSHFTRISLGAGEEKKDGRVGWPIVFGHATRALHQGLIQTQRALQAANPKAKQDLRLTHVRHSR
jgi:hypothetical protein